MFKADLWFDYDGSAGDLSPWAACPAFAPTLHLYDLHAGDTIKVWGSSEDSPTIANGVEIATAITDTKAVIVFEPFAGRICVELDVDGGAATRHARLTGWLAGER